MKAALLMIAAVSTFLLSTDAFAASTIEDKCIDPRASHLFNQFDMHRWPISEGPNNRDGVPFDFCRPESVEKKAIDALLFLEDFGQSSMPADDFDHKVTGDSLHQFFRDRIRTIFFDSETDGKKVCSDSTVAYLDTQGPSNTMHVCPYSAHFSTLQMGATLLHESRHVDGFPHAVCDMNGSFMGQEACDKNYTVGGSYGVGVEFFVRVARQETASAVVRQEARASAAADLLNRFNEKPLDTKLGMILQSEDGDVEFFDGKIKSLLVSEKVPRGGQLGIRDLPTFFDPETGTVQSHLIGFGLLETPGVLAEQYRALSKERRQDVRDVYYGTSACLLFKKSLLCVRGSDVREIPLPADVNATRFVALNTDMFDIVFVRTDAGHSLAVPMIKSIMNWKEEDFVVSDSKALTNFLSFGHIGETRFGLSLDGQMLTFESRTREWKPVPQLKDRRYNKLLRLMLWSPRLNEI